MILNIVSCRHESGEDFSSLDISMVALFYPSQHPLIKIAAKRSNNTIYSAKGSIQHAECQITQGTQT